MTKKDRETDLQTIRQRYKQTKRRKDRNDEQKFFAEEGFKFKRKVRDVSDIKKYIFVFCAKLYC